VSRSSGAISPRASLSFSASPAALFDGRAQVELALGFDMPFGPVPESHGVLFRAAQGSARKQNLADPAGHPVYQRRVQLLAMGNTLHVIGELEHNVERNDALRFQDADDLPRHLLPRIGIAGFRRPGQQVHQTLVRNWRP